MSLRDQRESHRQDDDVEDSQDEDEEEDPPDLGETVEDLRQSIRDQAKTNQDLIVEVRMLNREKLAVEVERDHLKQELAAPESTDSNTDSLDSDTPTVELDSSVDIDNPVAASDSGNDSTIDSGIDIGLTGEQLAKILECNDGTISRWRRSGKLRELGWDYRPSERKGYFKYFPVKL